MIIEYVEREVNESKETAYKVYEIGRKNPSKENFNKLLEVDKKGVWIYHAGENWKEFDYKRGLDKLLKVDKKGNWIYFAGQDWKEFDYERALKALKGTEFYEDALNKWWKKSPEIAKIKNKMEIDKAEHMPQKKFKLKEFINEDIKYINETTSHANSVYTLGFKNPSKENFNKLLEVDKIGKWIYTAGKDWKEFDFKRGLDRLLEVNKNGKWIYLAGIDWKKFDFKRGLDRLLELNKTGYYIYLAGKYWKEFDFKKALDRLLELDKIGEWIFNAGKEWKEFDYEKGLDRLLELDKKNHYIYFAGIFWKEFDYVKGLKALEGTKYYEEAIDNWWKKSPEVAKLKNEKVKKEAEQMPKKKFKLKESINEEKETAKDIFRKGLKNPSKENLNKLLELDKRGEWIYEAGLYWKEFDYKRGLNKLIEVGKTGEWIHIAGKFWKEFDFKKGLDGLLEVDKDGEWIYLAGVDWKEFDFKRGFNKLLELDETGYYIYIAGNYWKEFDYEKALKVLEKTEYYKIAINAWWKKSPEIAKLKNEKVKKEAEQMPKKKFKLKENKMTKFDLVLESFAKELLQEMAIEAGPQGWTIIVGNKRLTPAELSGETLNTFNRVRKLVKADGLLPQLRQKYDERPPDIVFKADGSAVVHDNKGNVIKTYKNV